MFEYNRALLNTNKKHRKEHKMRKLVTLRTVAALTPIANADRIELATIDGWKTIVKKGELTVGGYCVYLEIDSLIPMSYEPLSFIPKKRTFSGEKYLYLTTMKMRGTLSQGLAMPVHALPEIAEIIGDDFEQFLDHDFSETIGVLKYEEPSALNVAGDKKADFPFYVRKTSENRIQNVFEQLKEQYFDLTFVPTLKMDGSSLTAAYVNTPVHFIGSAEEKENLENQFWVASHTQVLKSPEEAEACMLKKEAEKRAEMIEAGEEITDEELDETEEEKAKRIKKRCKKNGFYHAVDSLNLRTKIAEWCETNNTQIALQAELLGPKIQGNFEKFNDYTLRAFNVFFIEEQRYATPEEFLTITDELEVPIVTQYDPIKVFQVCETVDDLLEMAEGASMNRDNREGLVFKSTTLVNGEVISFKVISNSFLLLKGRD